MIRGILFDFDGLMVDTETPAFRAWQEIYEEYGLTLALETWFVALGTLDSLFDPFTELERQAGRPLDHAAIRERRAQRKAELAGAQGALPGVRDYLAGAQRLGLKLGVVSSSSREWVTAHLTRLGLLAYFDDLKGAEDVVQVKPDPELYLSALAALGLSTHEAIVLEDSPNGIRAANRAGIFCVAVPSVLTSQLDLNHADMQVASLAQVPLTELLAQVEARRRERATA